MRAPYPAKPEQASAAEPSAYTGQYYHYEERGGVLPNREVCLGSDNLFFLCRDLNILASLRIPRVCCLE